MAKDFDPPDTGFQALLEAAPDAMIIADEGGIIQLVNAQAEQLFGYNRRDLLGHSIDVLVPERYRPAHEGHRRRYFVSAHPRPMGAGLALYGLRRDGSEFPVEISLSPLVTEQGTLAISAIRDISERKAAEAERDRLREERAAHAEANRIKDEFLATLSHELRTPLNAVLGWIDLVTRGVLADEEMQRALLTIKRNAKMQAQLVEDLLDVSRIVSGKLQIRPAALDLVEVAEAAIDVVRPAAAAKNITISVAGADEPLLIVADADRLQQVIWNLLSNAVKFTPPHGRVDLQMRAVNGGVELVVRDSGEGIAPAFLAHVFERFRQENSTPTRAHGGLGLGLSIARSIVERHGGSIAAESAGIGQGAAFRVFLPVAQVAERRKARRASTDISALRGARILVVDDQEDDRALLIRIFEHASAAVRGASSVREALQSMAEAPTELIVSDLAMPGEDGYGLIRRLRNMSEFRSICAIAVTAHARPEDRDAALAAGFDAYVSKPIDTDTLLRRAAELFWGGCRDQRGDG